VAVAWSAADLFYFAAGFTWLWLGLSHSGAAQQWFVDQALLPTTALREGMLLVVIGWCIHRMSTPERDSAQGGEHPGGSSANVA
jgi:hypothetical protein